MTPDEESIAQGDVFVTPLPTTNDKSNDVVWMVLGEGRDFPLTNFEFTILVVHGDVSGTWKTGEVFDAFTRRYDLFKLRRPIVQRRSVQ